MNGRDLLDAMEYISDDLIEEAAEWVQKGKKRKVIVQKWVAAAAGVAVLCVSALTLKELKNVNNSSGAIEENYNYYNNNSSTNDTARQEISGDKRETKEEENEVAAAGEISQSVTVASEDMDKQDSVQDNCTEESAIKQENVYIVEDFPPKYPYREPSKEDTEVASYASPEKGTYVYSPMLTSALEYYDRGETSSSESAITEDLGKPCVMYHITIQLFGDREESRMIVYGEIELNADKESLLTKEYERLLGQGYDVSLSKDYELEGLFTKAELETFDALPEYGYVFSLVSE